MITKQKLLLYCNFLLPKTNWILAVLMLLFSVNQMSAQGKTITGVVTSAQDNLPLPGVNIIIKGTKTVTTTGFDGEYSIKASPTDVLVFSFIGFQNKELAVGSQSKIDIALGEDTNKLNEVVVIGYGTQKKSDLTGSVSVVNLESAKKVVTYDAAKMLQGQVPGVTVQSSGEPGGFVNVKIRGITSFSNNNPLFVIDGIMVDSPYDFAPGEIESMQVLKDASSAAIYGARAAFGVVLITTKSGKKSMRPSVNLSMNYSTNKPVVKFETMDAMERMTYMNTANMRVNGRPYYQFDEYYEKAILLLIIMIQANQRPFSILTKDLMCMHFLRIRIGQEFY